MKNRNRTLLILFLIIALVMPNIVNAEWVSLGWGDGGGGSSSGGSGGSSSSWSSSSGSSWSSHDSATSASTSDFSSWRDSGGSGSYSWSGTYDGGYGLYEVTGTWGGGDGSWGGGGDGGGGPVCTDSTVNVDAPDFEISKVVPLVVKNSYKALIGVNVHNKGSKEATTKVAVQIGSETITMSDVKVPAGNHALSFGYYTPKATGKYDIKVTVNGSHPTAEAPKTTVVNSCRGGGYTYEEGAEYSYSNNTWTGSLTVTTPPSIANPNDPAPKPVNPKLLIEDLPEIIISPTGGTGSDSPEYTYTDVDGTTTTIGNNRIETTWVDSVPTGTDKTYKAKLDMTVKVLDRTKECTALKSGYGFSLEVTCKVTTDYPTVEKVEAPKQVLCYIPDFGDYKHAVELKRTDSGGAYARTTTWQLPANTASGTNANKWYVPKWWADGKDYTFLVASKGVYTPGGELTAASKHTIHIDSSMYSDDYSINK